MNSHNLKLTKEEADKAFWILLDNAKLYTINGRHYYMCQEVFEILEKYSEEVEDESIMGA